MTWWLAGTKSCMDSIVSRFKNCMFLNMVEAIWHYNDVIMSVIASRITSLTIVYSTVYSRRRSKKHHSTASLAFVRGIHRGTVNSPHKGPVTRKMLSFDDVIMDNCHDANFVVTGDTALRCHQGWQSWHHVDWVHMRQSHPHYVTVTYVTHIPTLWRYGYVIFAWKSGIYQGLVRWKWESSNYLFTSVFSF